MVLCPTSKLQINSYKVNQTLTENQPTGSPSFGGKSKSLKLWHKIHFQMLTVQKCMQFKRNPLQQLLSPSIAINATLFKDLKLKHSAKT